MALVKCVYMYRKNNHVQEVMACMAYISFVMNPSALTSPPPPPPLSTQKLMCYVYVEVQTWRLPPPSARTSRRLGGSAVVAAADLLPFSFLESAAGWAQCSAGSWPEWWLQWCSGLPAQCTQCGPSAASPSAPGGSTYRRTPVTCPCSPDPRMRMLDIGSPVLKPSEAAQSQPSLLPARAIHCCQFSSSRIFTRFPITAQANILSHGPTESAVLALGSRIQ